MRLLVGSLAALLALGCNGGGDGGAGPGQAPASVAVSASASGTINAFAVTRTLTATVRDASQAVIPGASVTWTASPAGIVTLSPASGLATTVTAVGNGTVTITARSGTVSATHAITVTQALASFGVSPDPVSVNTGSTVQLTATGRDPGGSPIATLQSVTYVSSDPGKATVNGSGLVTGVSAGSAQVTATATHDGATRNATVAVTVTAQSFPLQASVVAGNSTATFTPQIVDIAVGGSVTWTFGQLTHNVTFSQAMGAPQNIPTTTNSQVTRTFNTVGTFPYDCTIHPGMTGTVRVH